MSRKQLDKIILLVVLVILLFTPLFFLKAMGTALSTCALMIFVAFIMMVTITSLIIIYKL